MVGMELMEPLWFGFSSNLLNLLVFIDSFHCEFTRRTIWLRTQNSKVQLRRRLPGEIWGDLAKMLVFFTLCKIIK